MEDGDGDNEIMDTTTAVANDLHKEIDCQESNNEVNSNLCSDQIHADRLETSDLSESEDCVNKNLGNDSKIIFKGFKKRILAQTQENKSTTSRNDDHETKSQPTNVTVRSVKNKKSDTKRGKITEYAQYLGLQPAAKYKCLKCQSAATFSTMSMLKQHQRTCTLAMTPMQGVLGSPESSSTPLASNFRITRKVYLCSACGTYFENWNLFLHMREVHKRHICLFCLGMFGQAERLSYHLLSKHGVPEKEFQSLEDFYDTFKGSCYLICCNCEKVFSETDDFYNHFCSVPEKQTTGTACSVCRETDSHASSCTLAIEQRLMTGNVNSHPSNSTLPTRTNAQSSVGSSRGISKRISRNKRLKSNDSLKTASPSHQKPTEVPVMDNRVQPPSRHQDEDELDHSTSESSNSVLKIDLSRDTVAETIMEVSKYVEGVDLNRTIGKSENNHEKATNSELPSDVKECYDSVTETIMEVSRFHEDPSQVSEDRNPKVENIFNVNEVAKNIDSTGDEGAESLSGNVELDERLNSESPVKDVLDSEDRKDGKTSPSQDAGNEDAESQISDSSVAKPLAHSLFSPQHQAQVAEVILKENQLDESAETEEHDETGEGDELEESTEKEETNDDPSESQISVSFNSVSTTDRSLVIKICTNRVSKFSVATTNVPVNSGENYDTSRESEENNNGNGSTSEEKTPNMSEREKDSAGSYHLNEGESDSNSEKLAVVDASPEKTEAGAQEANEKIEACSDMSQSMNQEKSDSETGGIILAGEEVPSIDLNVQGTMESLEIEVLLKYCIDAASPTCVYCNHARQIAVNGKQLGLHMLAEHRFLPQHPAIIIQREQFTSRIKKALHEVEAYYFNFDSYNTVEGTYNVPNTRTYECFHCRFHSSVHKELYLHNRKMHQKTILICIMCKSTFYSYSELLCHLCPGVYSPNINVKYRCCLCPTNNLPSAFRLMVHLRKRHHACDVCLEATGNQQRLSNHVWKHKLHHLCYRCGIAYRNKPDITKHLFWKHGTESVLCKKCLQKKWPHVYHFCIPPTAFVCEECGSSFSRAVALKVHKRLHSGDTPHSCKNCSAQFISNKLLLKHQEIHKEVVNVPMEVTEQGDAQPPPDEAKEKITSDEPASESLDKAKDGKEAIKKVVDVYDLPPLNLSSDSDSDSDNEKDEHTKKMVKIVTSEDKLEPEKVIEGEKSVEPAKQLLDEPNVTKMDVDPNEDEKKDEVQIIDGIWDNFKSYTASLEMKESSSNPEKEREAELELLRKIIMADHDYCVISTEKDKLDTLPGGEGPSKSEGNNTLGEEHDYIGKPPQSPATQLDTALTTGGENEGGKKKPKTPRKKKQSGSTSSSESSSDSDSSCSCGTNCSCSSSSSGSSSSSSSSSDSDSSASEGSPRKQSNRKDRRKAKELAKRTKSDSVEPEAKPSQAEPLKIENGTDTAEICAPVHPPEKETLLRESDLDTDETETDEDFYDEHPQQLANKLLAEKRNQLMLLAAVAPASTDSQVATPLNNGFVDTEEHHTNRAPSPIPAPPEKTPQPKKKVKTKKRKKNEREKQRTSTPTVESIKLNIPKSFYQTKPGFASSSPAFITVVPSRSSTPNLTTPATEVASGKESQTGRSSSVQAIGSGSETDNKRSSKRKRVPKRFYGDSSGEESEKQPVLKWRKVEPPSWATTPVAAPSPPQMAFPGNSVSYNAETKHDEALLTAAPSESESEAQADSSSDSSESEVESPPQDQQLQQQELQQQQQQYHQQQQQQYHQQEQQHRYQQQQSPHHPPQPHTYSTENNAPVLERTDNLYCYCQCPYDEVSEMIACDGDDCNIEWFHFECVGIMVPPKGKWYCPDCRKKLGIVNTTDDYFD